MKKRASASKSLPAFARLYRQVWFDQEAQLRADMLAAIAAKQDATELVKAWWDFAGGSGGDTR